MKKSDRRIAVRINLNGSDQAQIKLPRNRHPILLRNITANGIRIEHTEKIPIGSHLEVLIKHIPSDSFTSVDSKVIWRKIIPNKKNDTNVATNDCAWEYGLLFFQVPREKIKEIEGRFVAETGSSERRKKERRSSNFQPFKEIRLRDRRGAKDFLIKLNRIATSFDKWTTYHTYLRPLGEIKYPYAVVHGQKKIMMGSNSYLGLSGHPLVKEAAIKAIEKFGVGSGGVPVLSGTTTLHEELCEKIAKFKGVEAAILYPSGYGANLACLSTLFGNETDIILNDERNHASIIDGCRMSKAKVRFFKHNDMEDLERRLEQHDIQETKLIAVDGVYSMDGDICNLPGVYSLAHKYNAMVMVDDAHATGVIGENGRGTANHFGLTGKIDLTTITLSKSIGCSGGAIGGSKAMIKFLIHLSRAYIFSTSLPPSVCAGAIAAFNVLEDNPQIVQSLRNNVRFIIDGLRKLGYKVQNTESAIIPVIIGDEMLTYKLAYQLEELGVFVNAVSRPAVPRELSRLRVSPNSLHTEEDLVDTLKAFETVGRKLGIIK